MWQLTIDKPNLLVTFHLLVHAADLLLGSNAGQSQGLDAQPQQPQHLGRVITAQTSCELE